MAPLRHRGGSQTRGTVRTLNWPYLIVVEEIVGKEEVIMLGHRMVFRVVAPTVNTLMMLLELIELCQVMDEVEVDLIKFQMSVHLGL